MRSLDHIQGQQLHFTLKSICFSGITSITKICNSKRCWQCCPWTTGGQQKSWSSSESYSGDFTVIRARHLIHSCKSYVQHLWNISGVKQRGTVEEYTVAPLSATGLHQLTIVCYVLSRRDVTREPTSVTWWHRQFKSLCFDFQLRQPDLHVFRHCSLCPQSFRY